MTVFNVEQEEHASRIARKEIGQRLENVPLKVLSVEQVAEDDEDTEGSADDTGSSPATDTTEDAADDGDDLIPEFDDLVEDS
jgi:hypothetical protein